MNINTLKIFIYEKKFFHLHKKHCNKTRPSSGYHWQELKEIDAYIVILTGYQVENQYLSKTSYPGAHKTTCNKMSRYAPSLTNARNSPRSSIVPSQQITKQNAMFISLRLSMVYSMDDHLYYTLWTWLSVPW